MKKKRITVQSAKAKGRRLQQYTGDRIAQLTGLEFGRDKSIESRGMGQSGVDVRLDKEALKAFPYSVECKHQEKWSVPQWIEQAKDNLLPNTNWLLVCKRNNHKPVAILDLDVFFELLKKAK